MTAPAAIMASLVDVRNISVHKCIRLEIHIPAEQAGLVLRAFGWPTLVDPVPVAIARLDSAKAPSAPPEPAKERRRFSELAMPAQAALRCQDVEFRSFLRSKGAVVHDTDEAADVVRDLLGIKSRSEILPDTPAGRGWLELERQFEEWARP